MAVREAELLADHPEFGLCRTLNHAWQIHDKLRKQGMTVIMTLRCPVCTGRRIDTILLTSGEVIARAYIHPDGYLLKGMEERPSKQDFRRSMVREMSKDRTNVIRIADVDTARLQVYAEAREARRGNGGRKRRKR